ncbi:MAG: response regulator transcription factor [Verrucomicrobiales bacterium]|nr:response regulator transcription factor [Verrucomicrobiales bacterium]
MNSTPRTAGRPIKFLVVDDHAGFRKTLRAFLPSGSVTECGSGLEALVLYAAEQPDWVLMDIEMPVMDGLTATRELLARFPKARVILVSNHDGEEFHLKARELGSYGFVHKSHLEEVPRLIHSHDLAY